MTFYKTNRHKIFIVINNFYYIINKLEAKIDESSNSNRRKRK